MKSKWENKSDNKRKLVGIVTIITGENVAKLVLQEDGKEFANRTDTLKASFSDLPKFPRLPKNDKQPKEYRIRMNSDGDKVEAIMPVRGHFRAKLVDLGPRPEPNADPHPEPPFKPFDENDDHLEFFAVYEILDGFFKGVQLPAYRLHYKFCDNGEGYAAYHNCNFDHPKATRARQLRDWMQIHGLEDDVVPWDDDTGNILPTLLERALDNDVEVEVNMAGGYILKEGGVVLPSDGYVETFASDEDDVDEEFPPVEEKKAKTNGKKVEKPVRHKDPNPTRLVPVKKATPAKPAKKLPKKSSSDEDDDL